MIKKVLLLLVLAAVMTAFFTGTALAAADSPLEISCADKTLRVVNGSSVSIMVEVANKGDSTVTDIAPQAVLPYKWVIEIIQPDSLSLQPGESETFTLTLAVPASQNASTHDIKLSCSNGLLVSNELVLPVAVSTDIRYLWFIGGGIAIVILITVIYFKKHGRR